LLAAVGLSKSAEALTRAGALADSAAAVEYYQVTCSDDGGGAPSSLALQVTAAAPTAGLLVSVQTQKGDLAGNTTDPTGGDSSPSSVLALNGGAGVYDVFVDKSGPGADGYTLTAQCKTGADGAGADTGTALTPITTSAPPLPALPDAVAKGLVAALCVMSALRARKGQP